LLFDRRVGLDCKPDYESLYTHRRHEEEDKLK